MPAEPSLRRGTERCAGAAAQAVAALVLLSGCSSIGDFGRLKPSLVTEDIHAWVGRDAARAAGAPVSTGRLTGDERTLRDDAFALIEPPYDRQRWDAVIYEYGINRLFRRGLWIEKRTAYYRHLEAAPDLSTAARYNRLIDDMRDDMVRLDPFVAVARRVVEADR